MENGEYERGNMDNMKGLSFETTISSVDHLFTLDMYPAMLQSKRPDDAQIVAHQM